MIWAPIRCATCRSKRLPGRSGFPTDHLCQACVTGRYPTACGQHLYQIALDNRGSKPDSQRTYEQLAAALSQS